MPEGAVYIGGVWNLGGWRLPRSKWRNPFKIDMEKRRRDGTREEVIAKYEGHLHDSDLINEIHELRDKDLACWCAPKPCHGHVLLRLANAGAAP